MRHAKARRRLSRPSEHREALLANLATAVIRHGRIRTTVAKAKEARRLVDRLVSWGKDGSVHARRQAYRILQDRQMVKQLFAEVAPRFLDCQGGYTRVLRWSWRPGDGAPQALLELTRLPAETPSVSPKTKAQPSTRPQEPGGPQPTPKAKTEAQKPKRLLEGLRHFFRLKKWTSES